MWILDRYYKKISAWQYKCLSLAGRVILAQSVLNQMVVYWAHLFFLPANIIMAMNKLTTNFIWGGQAGKKKFHLSALSNISMPKSYGGWGLLDLKSFGRALLCKTLWRGIFENGPWSNIVRNKYLRRKDLAFWLRKGKLGFSKGSPVWLSIRKIGNFLLGNLSWHFQSGKNILIGKDHFMSGAEAIEVQDSLLNFLHRKGMFYWDSLIASWRGPIPLWKEADSLGMPTDIAFQWDQIRIHLRNCGIFRSENQDGLMWKSSKAMSVVQVKDVYRDVIGLKPSLLRPSFPPIFWKSGFPSKMIFFSWLSFHNRNLSWENLRKRGWQGPGVCPICWSDEESNFHLFLDCKKTCLLWRALEECHGIQHMSHSSISEAFLWSSLQKKSWRSIFIIAVWCIWKWCNKVIFNSKASPFLEIISIITSIYELISQCLSKRPKQNGNEVPQELSPMPKAFFDEAEQGGQCGCGVIISVNENCHFLIYWNGGRGSNSKAEVMALAGLLHFCLFLNIQDVSIFGDSKVMVDGVLGKNIFMKPQLIGWIDRIKYLWNRSKGASIHHIKRALNQQADDLSKRGL